MLPQNNTMKQYTLTIKVPSDRLQSITPEKIKSYLTKNGWTFDSFYSRKLSDDNDETINLLEIWVKTGIFQNKKDVPYVYDAHVPLKTEWADYQKNIVWLLQQISEEEQRGTLTVLEDIEKT